MREKIANVLNKTYGIIMGISFFAGILPYYAIERKLSVQVAYLVQHFEASGVQNPGACAIISPCNYVITNNSFCNRNYIPKIFNH